MAPLRLIVLMGLSVLVLSPQFGLAQTGDTARKTVTIYAGGPVGGGIDLYARLVARHLGRHLPDSPSVVVSNMPGAGSISCANFIHNVAPKDGTAIAIVQQGIAEEQAFGTEAVRFDARKFGWVGRIASNVEISYVWHTVPVRSIEDLKSRETVFAALGLSSIVYPELLNGMIGTRIKLVRGYTGTPAAHVALERGEVEGSSGSLNTMKTTSRDWMLGGKVRILVQYALQRHPELPDVPAIVEFGATPQDRAVFAFYANSAEIGRSIIAPPGLPPQVLNRLRTAFAATMKDPQFVAEIKQIGADFDPSPGEELESIVERTIGVSPESLERARAVRALR